MTIHHVTQQHDNSDRGEQWLSRKDWPLGESRDYTGHDSERGQQDNVDFRMTKEPPDMVPEERPPCRRGEEEGPENPASLQHYEPRDEKGKSPENLGHRHE